MLSSSYFNHQNNIFEENSFIYSSVFTYLNQHYLISYPNRFSYSIAHIQNNNDFWINRTLLIKNSSQQIEFISFTLYDDLFSKLFNQSYLIPFRRQNEIYIQQKFDIFQKLKINFNQPLYNRFRLNIRYETQTNNEIDIDLFIGNTTIFHIKFGSTYNKEYQQFDLIFYIFKKTQKQQFNEISTFQAFCSDCREIYSKKIFRTYGTIPQLSFEKTAAFKFDPQETEEVILS